ncbi:MAG: hydrogenase maturation protein [Betaproteobacteria bacterium]|nr:hydrogenase maturation protein [Betaproteobacteria bacterium]
MRILFLTHSFNSLSQRLYAELAADGHELSVEFDIADSVAEEAVALFRPDAIVAPMLRRAVPESIWSRLLVLIVHPGIVGDRGPSALDWAIREGETGWGVTVLQAEAEMDAGPVWAQRSFPMRVATKASLYRNEVTGAAVAAVREALGKVADWRAGRWAPVPLGEWRPAPRGRLRPLMRQADRAIDWARDDTATVLAKIRAADGFPGVVDELFGHACHLFDAHAAAFGPPEGGGGSGGRGAGGPSGMGIHPAAAGATAAPAMPASDADSGAPGPAPAPGTVIARRHGALLRATRDGAVWIGHVKRGDGPHPFKLPATLAFAAESAVLPDWTLPGPESGDGELRYRETDGGSVGWLAFDFYNGAASTAQCERLREALDHAAARPTRVLVLGGGRDFWCNGIHLNVIEAADSPADESWRNIQAMDDVCLAILGIADKLTVAALRGNAGAGGLFLALAADRVWGRDGVVLNPHYRNMGNLYGSEYWTYLLPRRVGEERAAAVMRHRLPLLAAQAREMGLIDACFGADAADFDAGTAARARALAASPDLERLLERKRAQRAADEAARPLARYRAAELEHMRRNFYGFDPSYHVARYHFVTKTPHSWTPRHLARHRDLGWEVPVAERAA